MELMLQYKCSPPQSYPTYAIHEHGQQLLAELKQHMPKCMESGLEQNSCRLSMRFLAANRYHCDLICFVELALLTGGLVVKLGFFQERSLQCRSLQ